MYIEEAGAKVVAVEDHTGTIVNEAGIDMKALMDYNKEHRCIKGFPGADAVEGSVITMDVDVLMPCALENQITSANAGDVKAKIVCEGANGPTTPEADAILFANGVTLVPDILANSGGVTVSYFEWVQNLMRYNWTFEEVQDKQKALMVKAFEEATIKLEVGKYTAEPVETEYGYHIILKTGQKDKKALKDVKEEIIDALVEEKMQEDDKLQVKALAALREEHGIEFQDNELKKQYKTYLENNK